MRVESEAERQQREQRLDAIVARTVTDLADFFAELDDSNESTAMFGDFARVNVDGNVLTVLHETQDLGIRVTVDRVVAVTKTGLGLTNADIEALAAEAKRGYCVAEIGARGAGDQRFPLGPDGQRLCGHVLPCPDHG